MSTLLHQKSQHLPTPMAGLALGIASLGLCLEQRLDAGLWIQLTLATVAAALWLMLTVKFLLHPSLLRKEIACPLVGSVIPTYAMGAMILSKTLGLYQPGAATLLWSGAVVMHLILMTLFLYHRLKEPRLTTMLPSWFVPPVGIIVAALSYPNDAVYPLAKGLMWLGLANYALLLPLMIYRLTCHRWDDPKGYPTFAIMAAPASLALTGYLAVVHQPDTLIINTLLPLALLMTTLVYLAMFRLLRLPFSPGYAAFTFPLVISATALYQCLDKAAMGASELTAVLRPLADLELLLASLMVGYVALRYAVHFWPSRQPGQ
ncbi:TDT family transporter [Ferrimonas sp. YFM]|uniref:TDT family transporter n=1 Tax=Ferrimonas sp. YFM TaxID=3028878 RepID=UPI00257488B4|nr:TDT family transporter [Ferrimonas sp. YFM]BDY04534.1 C4-dicarboxylate ABC transporter [Ferrimonas sp. YFM]